MVEENPTSRSASAEESSPAVKVIVVEVTPAIKAIVDEEQPSPSAMVEEDRPMRSVMVDEDSALYTASVENSTLARSSSMDNKESEVLQLLITEIMADPDPQVLLPAAEYIEVFNRGSSALNIKGWKITIGSREAQLPDEQIMPGEYAIICGMDISEQFINYGRVIAVKTMPAILNSGQLCLLKNAAAEVVHAVQFSSSWYGSDYKSNGGWSLEMIDTGNPCGGAANWSESLDYRGGTPGEANSVSAYNPDNTKPWISRVAAVDSSAIRLFFNESMDSASLCNKANYSTNSGYLRVRDVIPQSPLYSEVILRFHDNLEKAKIYKLLLQENICDCVGNGIEKNITGEFALAEEADSFDIVINELLIKASGNMPEYIELYNRSDKITDLAGFALALEGDVPGTYSRFVSLADIPAFLFPGKYVAVCRDISLPGIKSRLKNGMLIAELPSLFSLPDAQGVLVLLDRELNIIDRFAYSGDMHSPLLKDSRGVSLERVNPHLPSNETGNWHTASEMAGYATPGSVNSQMQELTGNNENIDISPVIFSPDNDGYDDLLSVRFSCDEPGFIASVKIFDRQGRLVKSLASNMLTGSDNLLVWEGKDMSGSVAQTGIYIVFLELAHPSGKLQKYKKAVALVKSIH